MWKIRPYLRLLRLSIAQLRRAGAVDPRDDAQVVRSEVEAIHCALGHGYQRSAILPSHKNLMRPEAWGKR